MSQCDKCKGLSDALVKAIPFMRHNRACRWEEKGKGPCNCGRDKLLEEIKKHTENAV